MKIYEVDGLTAFQSYNSLILTDANARILTIENANFNPIIVLF